MKKEIIIVILVIMLVIGLNIITSNNTNRVMDDITESLSLTRDGLMLSEKEQMLDNIDNAMDTWEKEKNLLSMYIEHDELEKVEMYMINVKTNIETEKYNSATEALDTCNFMIEHIKDKYKLSIKNIF